MNTVRKSIWKRLSTPRNLSLIGGGVVLALVACYFIIGSSAFLKGFVLPKVNRALEMEVSADSISLSLFSQCSIRGLKVRVPGAEPLVEAQEAVVRYQLFSLLKGHINAQEVKLVSPVFKIIQTADGKNNLPPTKPAAASGSQAATKPLVSLKNINVSQGRFLQQIASPDGSQQKVEISGLNLTIDRIENGQPGKITIDALAKIDQTQPLPGKLSTNHTVEAKLSGSLDLKLANDLLPWQHNLSGSLRLEIGQAKGAWSHLASAAVRLDCQVTPTQLNQLALRFERQNENWGGLSLSGPLDLVKQEASLKLEIGGIDRRVLNFIGGPYGLDFASTSLNSTNTLDIRKQGKSLWVRGRLAASPLSLQRQGLSSPKLNLGVDYNFSLDLASQSLLVERLNVQGLQEGREMIRAALNRPMTVVWNAQGRGFKESALELTVTNLNLQEWGAFLPVQDPQGSLNASGQILCQKDGQDIGAQFQVNIANFQAKSATNLIQLSRIDLNLTGGLHELRMLEVKEFRVEAAAGDQLMFQCKGSGTYDKDDRAMNWPMSFELNLPWAVNNLQITNFTAQSGGLRFLGLLTSENQVPIVKGSFTLDKFTGKYSIYEFANYEATLEATAEIKDRQLVLRLGRVTERQQFETGGRGDFTARFDATNATAYLSVQRLDVNRYSLLPYLKPWIAPLSFASGNLSGDVKVGYPQGVIVFGLTNVTATNLVVLDPSQLIPPIPLSFKVDQMDLSLDQKGLFKLNSAEVELLDGPNPCGHCSVKGSMDLNTKVSKFDIQLANVNQNALQPWLAERLAPKTLTSALINGQVGLEIAAAKEVRLDLNLSVSNLVATETGAAPPAPMSLLLQVNYVSKTNLAEIKKFFVGLPSTARARNQLQVSGQVDTTQTNAYVGEVTVQSDGLDLTPLYAIFAGGAKSTNAPAPKAPAAVAAKPAEPGQPLSLPFKNFNLNVKIDQFYLGEISASNLVTTLNLAGNKATLQPTAITLNGAPVKARGIIDLGVPGYGYDLDVQAGAIPMAPFANTFSPASKGQIHGEILAAAQIKGAGTSGLDLQKNLAGQMSMVVTNANITQLKQIQKFVLPAVKIVFLFKQLSSMEKATAATSLVGALTQKFAPNSAAGQYITMMADKLDGGKADESLGTIVLKLQAASGNIDFKQFSASNSTFMVYGAGNIALNPVLTNSVLNLPINVIISGLATQGTNVAASAPAQEDKYLTISDTIGSPGYTINTEKLPESLKSLGPAANLILKQASALTKVPNIKFSQSGGGVGAIGGGSTADLLQGVAGLLQKPKAGATNAAPGAVSTNQAPGNQTMELIQGVAGLLQRPKPGATNAPAAAKTNPPPANPAPATNAVQKPK